MQPSFTDIYSHIITISIIGIYRVSFNRSANWLNKHSPVYC